MTDWFQYTIGHGYYPTINSSILDTPHFANDIETPFHTELTAPLAGTVSKADFQSWGGELFIKPDDTSKPTYYMYHLDTLDPAVHAGAHVALGQNLGLSGGENTNETGEYPGSQHPTDPMWSTGPHTHIGWFDGYVTTAYESLAGEETATIPHGPDITPFILRMQQGGIGAGSGVNVASSGQQADPYPGGVLNPFNWQTETQNANAALAASIANWFATKVGPFLLRVAVGGIGIGLMFFGTKEVVDSLKNIPASYQKIRGSTKRAKSQPRKPAAEKKKPAAKTPEKKFTEKPAKKEEKKPATEQKKPAAKSKEQAAQMAKSEKAAQKASTAEKAATTVAEVAA